jgi:hypothetical protein
VETPLVGKPRLVGVIAGLLSGGNPVATLVPTGPVLPTLHVRDVTGPAAKLRHR